MIFTILILIVSFLIIRFLRERQFYEAISKNFNGLPRNYFFGGLLSFPKAPGDLMPYFIDLPRKYGLNYHFWQVLNNFQIVVTDPKDIETILTSKTATVKGTIYTFLEPWIGKSILIISGERWFQRRKINTPSFHFNILDRFYEVFNQTDVKLIQKLNEKCKTGEFDIQELISNAALDNITETAMGVKLNALDNPRSEYIDAIHEMSSIFLRRITSIFHFYPTLYKLTPDARRTKAVVKILHDFTNGVIEARKKILDQNQNSQQKLETEDDSEYGGKKRLSLLDMLLQVRIDGKPLPDEHIREEVDTFLVAGHDTTTAGVTFALMNLAKNPDIQEQLYQELVEHLGEDPDVPVVYSDLQNLKYLDKVIKETLRINPSAPIISPKTVEEITIGGVKIPPGINITITIIAMHHNPKIFPDPDKFDPERFSEEEVQKRGPYDYIPFSAGQRNCIGQRFAIMELKTMLTAILRNFKVLPSERLWNLKLQGDIVLRPIGGVYLKLEKRIKTADL